MFRLTAVIIMLYTLELERLHFSPALKPYIYLVAENETNKEQIIHVQTKSKLCSKRKHGSGIECQHSGECFANIDMTSNIGNEKE